MHHFTANSFYKQTCEHACSIALTSHHMNCLNSHFAMYYALYSCETINRKVNSGLTPVGVRPQLRIALVAMLTFCLIIRKRDHQKCYQNHIPPALLNRPDVRCLSILTKIAMYSCAHVAHSRKIPINPSAS